MLLAPRFAGLDLPVFEPEARPVTNRNLEYAAEAASIAEDPTFVRAVSLRVENIKHERVAKLLRHTDEELERVAALCGARVIEHTWGLAEIGDDRSGEYAQYTNLDWWIKRQLPKNHILAARVTALKDARKLKYEPSLRAYERVSTGVDAYYGVQTGYILADFKKAKVSGEQFVTGISPVENTDDRDLWVVDIEPRIYTWA